MRYSYWDLLSDVGGLKDGLLLLGSIILSPYARLAFMEDYLNSTEVESLDSKSESSLENSEGFNSMLSTFEAGQKLNQNQIFLLDRFNSRLKVVNYSMLRSCCFLCGLGESKKQMKKVLLK